MQGQIAYSQEQESETEEKEETVVDAIEEKHGCKYENGYLYIDEWGYKIKIPDNDSHLTATSIMRCEYSGENDYEQPPNGVAQYFRFNHKYANRPAIEYTIIRQKGESDWRKVKSENWVPIELNDGWEYRLYYAIPSEESAKERLWVFTDPNNYSNI